MSGRFRGTLWKIKGCWGALVEVPGKGRCRVFPSTYSLALPRTEKGRSIDLVTIATVWSASGFSVRLRRNPVGPPRFPRLEVFPLASSSREFSALGNYPSRTFSEAFLSGPISQFSLSGRQSIHRKASWSLLGP